MSTELLKAVCLINTKDNKPTFLKKNKELDEWVKTEPNMNDHYVIIGEPEKIEVPSDISSDPPIVVRVFTLLKNQIGYPVMLLLNKKNKS